MKGQHLNIKSLVVLEAFLGLILYDKNKFSVYLVQQNVPMSHS